MKYLYDELREMGACEEGLEWVGDRTLAEAWRDCPRSDWMFWLIGACGGNVAETADCATQLAHAMTEASRAAPAAVAEQVARTVSAASQVAADARAACNARAAACAASRVAAYGRDVAYAIAYASADDEGVYDAWDFCQCSAPGSPSRGISWFAAAYAARVATDVAQCDIIRSLVSLPELGGVG
jgi:hypothetical protein